MPRSSAVVMRVSLAVVAASAIGGAVPLSAAGCLLTSDFNGVAGDRPVDADLDVVVDAAMDVDAGDPNAFPCVPGAHLLCTNFDQGTLDSTGWVVNRTGASSKAVLDNTIFHSPPGSFHSTIGAAAVGLKIGGILRQTPAIGAFKTLTLAFDIMIKSCLSTGSGGSVTLAAIQPSDAVAFGLVLLDSNLYSFGEVDLKTNAFTPSVFTTAPKPSTWQRINIKLSLSTSAAHVVVMLDTKKVVDVDQIPGASSPSVLLNIGANATGPIAGCDVVYDNVTFDKD